MSVDIEHRAAVAGIGIAIERVSGWLRTKGRHTPDHCDLESALGYLLQIRVCAGTPGLAPTAAKALKSLGTTLCALGWEGEEDDTGHGYVFESADRLVRVLEAQQAAKVSR